MERKRKRERKITAKLAQLVDMRSGTPTNSSSPLVRTHEQNRKIVFCSLRKLQRNITASGSRNRATSTKRKVSALGGIGIFIYRNREKRWKCGISDCDFCRTKFGCLKIAMKTKTMLTEFGKLTSASSGCHCPLTQWECSLRDCKRYRSNSTCSFSSFHRKKYVIRNVHLLEM